MNKPFRGLFVGVLLASLGVVSSALGDAAWTLDSYDSSTWTIPEDSLSGNVEYSNNGYSDFKVNDDSFGHSSVSQEWSFAEPKNLSAVSIYMDGVSYNVEAIYVRYAGDDTNYYAVSNSDFDLHSGHAGEKVLTWADSDGYFAENVSGFRISITNMYPTWAGHKEILVRGDNAGSDLRWTLGKLTDAADFERAADCLSGLVTPKDYPDWGSYGKYVNDGNVSNCWYTQNKDLVWNFDAPKRIRRIAVYGSKDAGGIPKIGGVYVKRSGDVDYSLVTGSSLDSYSLGNKVPMYSIELLSPNDLIASDVVSVKFCVSCPDWRIAVGEAEVDGSDSFLATLTASYLIGGGKLNTTLTPNASSYPKQVWFCSGTTDGGTDTNAWDRVVPAYIASSADSVVDSRTVDFKFCRYCFMDVDNTAWTDTYEYILTPDGAASVVSCRRYNADVAVSVTSCGGTNEIADIYFAYAATGTELSEYSYLASGAVGFVVTNHLSGLSETTGYDYSVKIVNVNGGEKIIAGSFTTTAACYWEKKSYDASLSWTKPSDRIVFGGWLQDMGPKGQAFYDDNLSTYITRGGIGARGELADGVVETSWQEPKDILSIDLYTSNNDWAYHVLGVAVMFDGQSEYVTLGGTALDYTESVSGMKLATLNGGTGPIATNVVGLRILFGDFVNGHAQGPSEIVVHGSTPGAVACWEVGSYTNAVPMAVGDDKTYALFAEELSGMSAASGAAMTEVLADHDLSTVSTSVSSSYDKETLTWDFAKPMNLTRLRLIAGDANTAFRCTGVYVKHKGDADYTLLTGSTLDDFDRGGYSYAIMTGATGKYFAKMVVSLKVEVAKFKGAWWQWHFAEADLAGRESSGFVIIVK